MYAHLEFLDHEGEKENLTQIVVYSIFELITVKDEVFNDMNDGFTLILDLIKRKYRINSTIWY